MAQVGGIADDVPRPAQASLLISDPSSLLCPCSVSLLFSDKLKEIKGLKSIQKYSICINILLV